ncbi:MAG: hypothetical protein DRN29_02305 [Thermoplasmata archaeon]|nr:MAG: hypothetical protein DRN29_02305 [Thermoplasmata archaeon]
MEWIKCECGNEEFKISTMAIAYCSKCMKPLEKEIKVPLRRPFPNIPEPISPNHPDIRGPLKF